jgi:hypothetical protein
LPYCIEFGEKEDTLLFIWISASNQSSAGLRFTRIIREMGHPWASLPGCIENPPFPLPYAVQASHHHIADFP